MSRVCYRCSRQISLRKLGTCRAILLYYPGCLLCSSTPAGQRESSDRRRDLRRISFRLSQDQQQYSIALQGHSLHLCYFSTSVAQRARTVLCYLLHMDRPLENMRIQEQQNPHRASPSRPEYLLRLHNNVQTVPASTRQDQREQRHILGERVELRGTWA